MIEQFRLPNNRQRIAIVGRTGSGKTQFGAWLLSQAPFDSQPYVIVDYKGDDLLNSVDRIYELGLNELPRHPGVYIIHPRPDLDDADVENWLRKVWERENIGLYFDETYMVPSKGALQGILTQGRSKNIPAICLIQRPAWISRFVLSEADFYAIFHLQHIQDRKKVQEFIPDAAIEARTPEYHSQYYDVARDALFRLKPVPDAETISSVLADRLKPRRRAM